MKKTTPIAICLLFLVSNKGISQPEFDVFEKSIAELQQALEEGVTTSVDLVEQYLERISAYDKQGPKLNSIVRINKSALQRAVELDQERIRSGPRTELHGIPILVKDNYNTTNMPTTGSSIALANFVPNRASTQVEKLLEAGAIIIAKTNLHEYAYGITSISSLVGQTRNPYDYRRVPGGSSGGTGAAVAASFGAIGLGSDTCGSIRIPSAFNNLVGLRPSKGLSSIFGIMPLSHSQDTGGPLARTVEDLAIVLDLTVGYDSEDQATEIMQSLPRPEFVSNLFSVDLSKLRFGKMTSFFDSASNATEETVDEALDWYESQGAEIIEVTIPDLAELVAASRLIGFEFRSDLNEYLEMFGSEEIASLSTIVELGLYHEAVQGRLDQSLSTEFEESDYLAAVRARETLREVIEGLFEAHNLDALVYPTIAQTPVFIGEEQSGNNCSMAAHSGMPAISFPAGFTQSGLPVGMELLGKHFQDAKLLAMVRPYEEANNHRRAPSVTPALVGGLAPEEEILELVVNQSGVRLAADFSYSAVTNLLKFEVIVDSIDSDEIHGLTLSMMEPEGRVGPAILNLLGPETDYAEGEYFMSDEFRVAFHDNRIYLRLFGDMFPVSGELILLE